MSFDPITGIWAANKAAEIVGESGGGQATEINLNNYGIDIFTPALSGGGTVKYDDLSSLQAKISDTEKPIFLTASFGGAEFVFNCEMLSRPVGSRQVQSVVFMGNVNLSEGVLSRITGFLSVAQNTLIVTVEQVGIPTTEVTP